VEKGRKGGDEEQIRFLNSTANDDRAGTKGQEHQYEQKAPLLRVIPMDVLKPATVKQCRGEAGSGQKGRRGEETPRQIL